MLKDNDIFWVNSLKNNFNSKEKLLEKNMLKLDMIGPHLIQ